MPAGQQANLRSLLVALDDSPASDAALKMAAALARTHGASLTGVTILDVEDLTAPEPTAIGALHFKEQADRARLRRARERNERLCRHFLEHCREAAVGSDILRLEGDPLEQLCAAAGSHDLIVMGQDTDFAAADDEESPTVERLLKYNPRPVIVTPPAAKALSPVCIAYDGSPAGARALQMFVLLGLAGDAPLHVVAIDEQQDDAERHARQAADYLRLHGSETRTAAIASSADPAELVRAEVQSIGAGLVVMGAYGRRGWRERLLGSFTTRLLADCPTTLFVHH